MSLLKKLLVAAAAAALGSAAIALPAQADTISVSPPGANDWSCVPSAAHPYPVILVPGTFESMAKNWATMSPVLKQAGYCVFALDYGQYNGVDASGPIAQSAQQLSPFVDAVLAATKARQVDLVGHSQGGMMPRYYLGFLGGAPKVDQLIGIAPSNHGTQGVIVPGPDGLPALTGASPTACPACADQTAGSAFLQKLNSIGDTVKGPSYTVISTTHDEVVTPYQSQALSGSPAQVTNTVIQNDCPADPIEHDQTPNDPVVQQLVLEALSVPNGPADPSYRPSCVG
ncbi:lipase family alpha/beta hydrolase [Leifsonia shinshuensis]|uniref:Alpha/beta fold hydrolase n=1 Tax=Leifsonia shinshuensis TaxID=150026 RepID=A0A7G6YBN4_9MICO|nr:alpha/beta fold hydrolase [Leifsonia shinshuensis]QNE35899.1 alpha/beta fold hydrolase [Leifsonia shinshuensis]